MCNISEFHTLKISSKTVKQNWIITAAHCLDAFPNAATTAVLVGDHDISTGTDTKWAAVYKVQSYIKHYGYRAENNINDIALIRTTNYIRYK
jgi:trypsin